MKNALVILLGLIMTLSSCQKTEKTAFIDLDKVVEEYQLMNRIKEDFKAKEDAFNKKFDSIARNFQQKVQNFQAKANRMNQAKAQKQYEQLMMEQQSIQMAQQQEAQKLQEELEKAMEEASDKLKDFIKDYGKKNDYTYIFSRSELAGIAYGKDEKDITDELIDALNETVKK